MYFVCTFFLTLTPCLPFLSNLWTTPQPFYHRCLLKAQWRKIKLFVANKQAWVYCLLHYWSFHAGNFNKSINISARIAVKIWKKSFQNGLDARLESNQDPISCGNSDDRSVMIKMLYERSESVEMDGKLLC